MRRAVGAVAVVLCVYAVWCSYFWQQTREAVAHVGDGYVSRRTSLAFLGLPILEIARRLDELLPRSVPVALAPSIAANNMLCQRLAEGLYPRRTDQRAAEVLALDHDGTVVSPQPDQARPAVETAASPWSFSFDLLGLLASVGALAGFGYALRWKAGRTDLPVAILLGAGLVGAIVYLETFAQIGLPWWTVRLAGWGCLAYGVSQRRVRLARPAPEAWLLGALIGVLVVRMAVVPVAGWDGRSVWLFHAKQIFFHRGMALGDLLHTDWQWSHPVYPMLVPGVMALFGGGGAVFNERMAALALPLIWGAGLAILWSLLREAAGRVPAAAITIALFFLLQCNVSDLYMDGLLTLLLCILILAISREEWTGLAILAACLASIVKIEGSVAACLVVLIRAARERRVVWLLPLALPLFHAVWLFLHGVTEPVAHVGFRPSRLPVLIQGVPQILIREVAGPQQAETQTLIRLGVAGLAAGLVIFAVRRRANPAFLSALGVGGLLVVLALALTCAMPQDAVWLVAWTLDRLLAHPAAAFAMLPFLLERPSAARDANVT